MNGGSWVEGEHEMPDGFVPPSASLSPLVHIPDPDGGSLCGERHAWLVLSTRQADLTCPRCLAGPPIRVMSSPPTEPAQPPSLDPDAADERIVGTESGVWIGPDRTLKLRPGDQPLPVRNDRRDIQSQVIADIEARREVGIARYGTALQPHNGRDALRDLYEELLDAVMYVRQVMAERSEPIPSVELAEARREAQRQADLAAELQRQVRALERQLERRSP
jgi:hypothetical protein